ncbi:MAG: MBL fold metallo-hydrolase [Ruminococcaceae bacterium]|nr:MBL fold metallo-hydrolase [Oscillospiraceae bacterium]
MQNPIKLTLPPLDENCYILFDGEKNAVIIDPGSHPEIIERELEKQELTPKIILLTHGHFDHISGAAYLKKKYGAKVYINENDECMLSDRAKSGALIAPFFDYISVECDGHLKEGDIIKQGDLEIKVLETPGHSKGSVCFICGDAIFAGDTLFKGSVGRTDLYLGNYRELENSLKKLTSLPGDYYLYCGHGEDSTLNEERMFNPYIMR